MADLAASIKALKDIEAGVGVNLSSSRLFDARVGGPHSGLVSIIFENVDLASWGATIDAEPRDRALQVLNGPSPDHPDELVDQPLFLEVPL